MSDAIERIAPDKLKEIFSLDIETGKITWLSVSKHHSEKLGREAGCLVKGRRGKDYWVVRIGGVAYKRSHIVFCLTHGRWPIPCADHENGNSLDDHPLNLREATKIQNSWNHKGRAKRSPYPMGVRESRGRFDARITCNKKLIFIGSFGTPEMASAAYQQKRKELFGEFA